MLVESSFVLLGGALNLFRCGRRKNEEKRTPRTKDNDRRWRKRSRSIDDVKVEGKDYLKVVSVMTVTVTFMVTTQSIVMSGRHTV